MSSEISKKRSVSSTETCSSTEVTIVEHSLSQSKQTINANNSINHYAVESTGKREEQEQEEGHDDLSLQDFIDAEINSRLSNITIEATTTESSEHFTCMSNNKPIIKSEEPSSDESITKSEESSSDDPIYTAQDTKQDTHIFLENEKFYNSQQVGGLSSDPENMSFEATTESTIVKINEENSVLKSPEESVLERPPSIKDKLMSGVDGPKMALLFSTTITSPAMTPTDEYQDFVVPPGVKQDSSIDEFELLENMLCREGGQDIDLSETSPQNKLESEEPGYKISDLDDEEVINANQDDDDVEEPEIDTDKVKMNNGDDESEIKIEDEVDEGYFIPESEMNTINSQQESIPYSNVPNVVIECVDTNKLILNSNSTTTNTIQSTMSETVEHTTNIIQDSNKTTQVKKKKSKKSKKDHEKENISVNENINYKDYVYVEDDLSQVNVKNLKMTFCDQSLVNGSNKIKRSDPIISTGISIKKLCQSFGDLTSLPDENNGTEKHSSSDSSPDSRAKSMIDLRRLEDTIYTGVSVKALKSSLSKFDALSKTTIHVRSTDASKAQTKFNGSAALTEQQNCKSCNKQVFQMEQIKAEKAIWHKNCFRCTECNKQLTVDTYQSHEATLYCKPHFKGLFAPKVVEDTQPTRPRKHELIIRESQPVELPPDVFRASDKPDLGLEELQSLNVKERFQVFEQANENQDRQQGRISPNVKRSASILSKLAKFQSKGMDIGVSDDALNGIPVETSSDESECDEDLGEDADLIRAQRKSAQKEQPIVFDKLEDLKSRWESGTQMTKDERRLESKQEIQSIRSRLFMGKQGKMKEMYQQAVMDSESGANVKKFIPSTEISESANSIKERFEKGENVTKDDSHKNMEEDMLAFEVGICKKSRDIFKELDASATTTTQMLPLMPVKSQSDIKRENSPVRDIYRDPDVVRAEEVVEDPTVAAKTHTATKMLSIFRQLEEKNSHEQVPTGLKPLKCFTPPPEPTRVESESEEDGDESSEDEEENEPETNIIRASDKPTDEFLIQAQNAARAKQLRAKFEKWEENEVRREQRENIQSSINVNEENSEEQIESARTLRARFESMRETTLAESKPKVKVHRFV